MAPPRTIVMTRCVFINLTTPSSTNSSNFQAVVHAAEIKHVMQELAYCDPRNLYRRPHVMFTLLWPEVYNFGESNPTSRGSYRTMHSVNRRQFVQRAAQAGATLG